MNRLEMKSFDSIQKNIEKIRDLFPSAVTEVIRGGKTTLAVDFDVLKQEMSSEIINKNEERYQFTWPGKRAAICLANTPTTKTLRPCKEESVNFDNTQNLYIEGDNLEALKLLQDTYMNRIKMIYIDPPYNTGSDFIYKDNFKMKAADYKDISGQFDEDGNRMVQNIESNGQYHTNWCNMIYPRLKLAKELLSDDGVIFISIDYNENYNMRKIANEIFGPDSFVGEITWESKTKSQNTVSSYNKLQPKTEMILVYGKHEKQRFNLISKGEKRYEFHDDNGDYREHQLEVMNANGIRGRETMVFPISDGVSTVFLPEGKQWKLGQDQVAIFKERGDLYIKDNKVIIKMRPTDERTETTEPFWGFFDKRIGTTESAKKELSELIPNHGFETVKPMELIKRLIFHSTDKGSIVLDFFSGSATTAHAVMQLNAEDGGNRKFVMVQLPEKCDEKSEAYKAGYKNICEIGKERIRRAGQKIKDEHGLMAQNLDIGFRVLKIDESNMKDVYYTPEQYTQISLDSYSDNIKPDRTPMDLLFQTMLELARPLSSKIENAEIDGKRIFIVNDNELIACFDSDITEETVKSIAMRKPLYAVFRDSSFISDSARVNVEQIFNTYSPTTTRRVL